MRHVMTNEDMHKVLEQVSVDVYTPQEYRELHSLMDHNNFQEFLLFLADRAEQPGGNRKALKQVVLEYNETLSTKGDSDKNFYTNSPIKNDGVKWFRKHMYLNLL